MTDTALRPDSWDAYHGQWHLKRRLNGHIAAAVAENRPLEHLLLVGPPGAGKTTLADIIAAQLTDPIAYLSRPVPHAQLVDTLYELGAGILFIDEVQMWSSRQQSELLGLLEDGEINLPWGGRERFRWLTVIAATTNPEKLDPAFEDRFLVQHFDPYTINELTMITTHMAEKAEVSLAEDDLLGIAVAAAGSPRQCRKLIFAARALSHISKGPVTIEAILDHAQLERDGLGRLEMEYLRVLRRHSRPVGLDVITDTLGVHRNRVRTVERTLVNAGFVLRTKGGRVLTNDGRLRITGDEAPARQRRSPRLEAAS